MGLSKRQWEDMQEAYPLTEAEEMEMMEQQLMVEYYLTQQENGSTGTETGN